MTTFCQTLVLLLLGICSLVSEARATDLQTMELTVDGVARTALVYVPSGVAAGSLPVVFAFHGHGGNSNAAAYKFAVNRLWPQAISVYPQGLPTRGALTDPDGLRAGWQRQEGELGDRDLHFFDAMLKRLEKEHPVDRQRIYCEGHSNGGGFTYLLWQTRPQVFAAVAVCSSGNPRAAQLTPKPAFIAAGREDELIPFARQEKAMDAVRQVNGGDPAGKAWNQGATEYASKTGTPLVTYVYPGGHAMDPAEPSLIVKFFQQHPGS